MHTKEQTKLAQELAVRLDELREKVLLDLGTNKPDQTKIFLVSTLSEMRRLVPPGARVPIWAVGMAFSRKNTILLRTRGRSGPISNLEQVFLHEWAHIALDHAVSFKPLPQWFQEGFAIYESGEWSIQRFQTLASGVVSKRLFSLDVLEENFPTSASDAQLAYAQSIDFVSYLLGEYGRKSFQQMIGFLGKGWNFTAALEEAYDTSLSTIEKDWRRDLKVRFTWIPILTGTAFLWFLIALIFLIAFIRKRRKQIKKFDQLDQEDTARVKFGPW